MMPAVDAKCQLSGPIVILAPFTKVTAADYDEPTCCRFRRSRAVVFDERSQRPRYRTPDNPEVSS